MESQSIMDRRSQAIWDLTRAAYKHGLLDELMGLAGSMVDPDLNVEEALDDLRNKMLEKGFDFIAGFLDEALVPVAKAMAEEEVIEAMKNLLIVFRPFLEELVDRPGGSLIERIEISRDITRNAIALKPIAAASAPAFMKMASPARDEFLEERAGQLMGNSINSFNAAINAINERDPEIISGFMSSLVKTIDAKEAGKAMRILMRSLLEHKPPLFRSGARLVASRLKSRFGK